LNNNFSRQPATTTVPSPKGECKVEKSATEWKVYRTRFLIRARQLTEPLAFVDVLGREHCGKPGDYLVESSDGMRRIASREIFEDVYVPMGPAGEDWLSQARNTSAWCTYSPGPAARAVVSCDS
jgi:hypothetical protein